MVGAITKIVSRGVSTSNERCLPVPEALKVGGEHDTIDYSLVVLRAQGNTKRSGPSSEEYEDANVRVGDELITTNTSGCGKSSYDNFVAPVVVECPTEQTERCARCILNLENGENVRKSMELSTPFLAHS